MSHEPEGFRHRLHVRLDTAGGPRGRLLRCKRKDGTGYYWRILLDSGAWEWPNAHRLIVDGPGDVVNPFCGSCRLAFMVRAGSGELLCDACSREQFGTDRRDVEFEPHHRRAGYARKRSHS